MKRAAFLGFCLLFVMGISPVEARVDVNINIGVPPPFVFEAPPELVVVPGAAGYVYMVPDVMGLYFYGGFWYRIHDGHWFRARAYGGPWAYIVTSRVPRVIINVPPDYYMQLPPGYHRIPYGDLHRHWRSWDRSRHWHRYDWYKRDFREHDRRYRREEHRPPGHRDYRTPKREGYRPPDRRDPKVEYKDDRMGRPSEDRKTYRQQEDRKPRGRQGSEIPYREGRGYEGGGQKFEGGGPRGEGGPKR